MTTTTPAERTRIVLVGIRNAGKSSLMNRLLGREASIVSETPGTTTDPVTRSMEIPPLGPVAITDTAGLDDEGALGEERIRHSDQRVSAADLLLFITPRHLPPSSIEQQLLEKLKKKNAPLIFVRTFADRRINSDKQAWCGSYTAVDINNQSGAGTERLLKAIKRARKEIVIERSPLEGLVEAGDLLVLVTPIDSAAPKGRLILPQVETIRDALDRDCATMVLKEKELHSFYSRLGEKPKLVITDSQAFHAVAANIPRDQPLTSFSILFARKKGEIHLFMHGIRQMESIPDGGRVLVMESCSHHRQSDDIGTVKIPLLFRQRVNPRVEFDFARSLPPEEELSSYSMVIHCAGCMTTRKAMLARLSTIERRGIPVSNYGLFIGWANGLLPRAIEPLPEATELKRVLEDNRTLTAL
ncbi:MAG TPA: [FeFe] hydrogenase H-cluster maturation GTPase HydF [Sediminispirochaeta sp.]|nr:[FeFe] hydrogenase H-cluster maturation GTPase HydF [Sediminispirochaeta sp.]